jgi:hypothetical protein
LATLASLSRVTKPVKVSPRWRFNAAKSDQSVSRCSRIGSVGRSVAAPLAARHDRYRSAKPLPNGVLKFVIGFASRISKTENNARVPIGPRPLNALIEDCIRSDASRICARRSRTPSRQARSCRHRRLSRPRSKQAALRSLYPRLLFSSHSKGHEASKLCHAPRWQYISECARARYNQLPNKRAGLSGSFNSVKQII